MMVIVLCCATSVAAGEALADPRLQEAQTAFDEARKLEKEGKLAEAITKGEHALALREAVLGSTHLEVAACLNLLGGLERQQRAHGRAETLLQRALTIREAALGKNHPDVAASVSNLALLYRDKGLYGQAEPLFQRALAIREAAFGKHHPEVAFTLNHLGWLSMNQGLYGQAEPLLQRALAIREAALDKNHPDLATSLHNLAVLYWAQGLYDRAEPLYQRTLAIEEATRGMNDLAVAGTLNNLASLYMAQGLYNQAEPLYQRALAIRELVLGQHNNLVAASLANLALLYEHQGLYGQAEPLYQRALVIIEAVQGKHHRNAAQLLNLLGGLYSNQGLYRQAEPLFQRALAIREAALGKNHPDVGESLANLATLYGNQGLYGRAEFLFQRALAILEGTLGKHHPHVAKLLNELAQLRLAQHRLTSALPLLSRAFTISEQRLRKEALDFSESRLATFLQFLRSDEERLYALLRPHPDNASVRRLALSAALLRKGRSVEETSNTSRTIFRSLGPEDRASFEHLRGLRTQLAQLSLQDPGSLSPADYQLRLKNLADQGDALEADLAKRSAPLRALAALPSSQDIVDRVASSLPKDGALIEFIAYADRPLVPTPGTPKAKHPSQLRYLALVLFPDGRIRAIDLGPAAPIDQAASSLRKALAHRDAAFLAPSQALYSLAFKPLLPLLRDSRRLFLSPDGQLALIPFSALHDGKSFLVDSFDFSYLTSGKDLLPRPTDIPSSGSVVVLADPDFSSPAAPPSSSQTQASALPQRSAALERFFSTLRADVADQAWAPLPGTRQEAQAIQRLIPQAQLFLGPAASKQQLLQLAAPGVLHIATHGFFLEDAGAPTGSRGVAHIGSGGTPAQPPPNPLLRSGLVLSGARAPAPATPESTKAQADSTLVTALELAGLNLWGTQLVVLSACDTGRGDVKLGQGVYGLRRALVTAGAETVVMSLWKVNDDTTRLLMEHYYHNLMAGLGRAAALQKAMLSLRQSLPHPYFWAPFIALGTDSPLRSLAPLPLHPPPVSSEIAGAYEALAL
ncbi:MAG TPA: CHAT domain-containing tetratricopeptide repeat protein [Hyalangium sp.]|nr:CHAT domain-containing tetratricopeptide repeat protein [Hyalangium sp.]